MEIKDCLRCGRQWTYRGDGRPIRCGQCKSPYWDKERVRAEEQVPPETMHPISPAAMAWLAEGAPGAIRPKQPRANEVLISSPTPKQPAPKKHNPKTCKIYKCGMCAVQGEK